MNPGNVFQLELAAALSRRRSLLMRLGVTVLFGLPFVVAPMPAGVKACGLVMVVVLTSVFGSAAHMARLRSAGHLTRLDALPLRRWVVMLDFLLAGSAVRLAPSGLILALFVLVNSRAAPAAEWAVLAGLVCGALVALNLLGMLIAATARNNAEVCLFGALAVGLVAFFSGLFPVPASLARLVSATAAWCPVGGLARHLQALADGSSTANLAQAVGGATIAGTFAAALVARGLAGKLKR